MTVLRPVDDRGSTLPIYIWLTTILLFAAFAFFAFAQAAFARNGAQSAADAAALAAAQEARDELILQLGDVIGTDDNWLDWLDLPGNEGVPYEGAYDAAQQLAAENDASVEDFGTAEAGGYPGFHVGVLTDYTVGDSIIPGTENRQARADAVAVIQPRCEFDGNADPTKPVEVVCDDETVNIDPEDFDLDDLPDASAMFSVRLAE
ncbi:pilus assembly protein TadG-related protein [Streptomyces bluensis]|uniref:pilus assembly protein TadG-related protein n=1 Tax=Streptomyces bluensis TaxID=33897 RepID=UPI0033329B6E